MEKVQCCSSGLLPIVCAYTRLHALIHLMEKYIFTPKLIILNIDIFIHVLILSHILINIALGIVRVVVPLNYDLLALISVELNLNRYGKIR